MGAVGPFEPAFAASRRDRAGGPRSVELLARAYRRHGLTDVEVKIYDEGRHEMFNELNQEEVRADVVAWLDRKLA